MDSKHLGIVIASATALLYLSGYGYLFGYYQYFDIGVWELRFSAQDVLAHAQPAILSSLNSHYISFVIFGFFLAVACMISDKEIYHIGLTQTSLIFGYVLILVAVYESSDNGNTKALRELSLLNRFEVPETSRSDFKIFFDGGFEMSWLHLTTANDTYYIIGVFESGSDRWVVRLPMNRNLVPSFVYQDP